MSLSDSGILHEGMVDRRVSLAHLCKFPFNLTVQAEPWHETLMRFMIFAGMQ